MKYIVGLDIGVTSIGWAMFELDENNKPVDLLDLGVRIFSSGKDAKTFAPTSVIRREKMGIRRNHERFIRRRNNLLKTLKNIGMLPKDYFENKQLEAIDPYELRNLLLAKKVELHHLGRAIFYLSKRRGFKSNRKSDTQSEDEVQGLKSKIIDTQKILTENNITLGQYLYSRRLSGKPIIQNAFKDKNDDLDNLFTSRSMVVDEFEKIMNFQQ